MLGTGSIEFNSIPTAAGGGGGGVTGAGQGLDLDGTLIGLGSAINGTNPITEDRFITFTQPGLLTFITSTGNNLEIGYSGFLGRDVFRYIAVGATITEYDYQELRSSINSIASRYSIFYGANNNNDAYELRFDEPTGISIINNIPAGGFSFEEGNINLVFRDFGNFADGVYFRNQSAPVANFRSDLTSQINQLQIESGDPFTGAGDTRLVLGTNGWPSTTTFIVNPAAVTFNTNFAEWLRYDPAGQYLQLGVSGGTYTEFREGIRTSPGSMGANATWNLGDVQFTAVTMNPNQSVEVQIGGNVYRLLTAV